MSIVALAQLEKALTGLSRTVWLLDQKGRSLLPRAGQAYALPLDLNAGETHLMEGTLYRRIEGRHGYVLAVRDGTGAQDCLLLASALAETLLQSLDAASDLSLAWQRLLFGEVSVAERETLVAEHRVPEPQMRSVLIMHMVQTAGRRALDLVSDILPVGEGDRIIGVDKHTVALVKNVTDMSDPNDLVEFARAVQETVLQETGHPATIGLSDQAASVADLPGLYRQARRAIEIGAVYGKGKTLFVYRMMMMERFLFDLSPDMAAHYHQLLFNRRTQRLFSDEMLETISVFFDKDLNLSETARALFIHRNTLVYRLDKVQRQLGLDLRHFHDAMCYQLLYELKKAMNNKKK